jgi:hypothetical protein
MTEIDMDNEVVTETSYPQCADDKKSVLEELGLL